MIDNVLVDAGGRIRRPGHAKYRPHQENALSLKWLALLLLCCRAAPSAAVPDVFDVLPALAPPTGSSSSTIGWPTLCSRIPAARPLGAGKWSAMPSRLDIGATDPPATGWVGFCRSLPFGLNRCTVQLCCRAIDRNRPKEQKLSNLCKRGFERPDFIPYATFATQGSGLIASSLPVG